MLLSGGQRETERAGDGGRQQQSKAGLREFAGSLVYTVIALTSKKNPADSELWLLARKHVKQVFVQVTHIRQVME